MSKQSDAKAAQKYTTARRNCGTCAHRTYTMELPAWMRGKDNYEAHRSSYEVPKNQRCGIGEFAVQMTATCDRWVDEWAMTRPGPFDDPEGDEAWRDAVAAHAGPFIPENY